MSKNIIVGVIILGIATGIMLVVVKNKYYQPAPTAIDTTLLEKNISELNALDSDMVLFNQDDIVSDELNETLKEVGEITVATNLNDDEQSLNNLSNDLINIAGDEAALNELDQALGDAAAN